MALDVLYFRTIVKSSVELSSGLYSSLYNTKGPTMRYVTHQANERLRGGVAVSHSPSQSGHIVTCNMCLSHQLVKVNGGGGFHHRTKKGHFTNPPTSNGREGAWPNHIATDWDISQCRRQLLAGVHRIAGVSAHLPTLRGVFGHPCQRRGLQLQ